MISDGNKKLTIDELATFCKRKGFAYPTAEIYGGLAGLYDYGHRGTTLKKNFENLWRSYFLELSQNFYEIEASEIMPEPVFVASGHLKNFTDIAAKCGKGHIERADYLLEKKLKKRFDGLAAEELFSLIKEHRVLCSVCGMPINYVGTINMMFPLTLGAEASARAFLRPETAQSPYVNFKTQFELMRKKLPLGLALIGRAYRNELSPRNFLLRQRAFTQAELQIFFNPSTIADHEDFKSVEKYLLYVVLSDRREKGIQNITCAALSRRIPRFYVYYMAKVQQFYLDVLKFSAKKFRFYELNESERAFYNKYHFDMEADLDTAGWTEIGGVHYRTDHDLKGHEEVSKEGMIVLDEERKERFIPHVLELSFGVDRNFYAILHFAYIFDAVRDNIVLQLHPGLAPVIAAVFPIVKNDEKTVRLSKEVYGQLRKEWRVEYDENGSVGKRYARNDEVGTPLCITIDEQSVIDKTVTIRDRDTTKQVRVAIVELPSVIREVLRGTSVLKLGKIVETRVKYRET